MHKLGVLICALILILAVGNSYTKTNKVIKVNKKGETINQPASGFKLPHFIIGGGDKMHKIDVKKMVNYSNEGPVKEIFYDAGNLKAQVVCLKAGQMIPPCKMTNDMLFYIVEGEGEITVDNKKEVLFSGISVIVPKEAESRSISAKTDMLILAVQFKNR